MKHFKVRERRTKTLQSFQGPVVGQNSGLASRATSSQKSSIAMLKLGNLSPGARRGNKFASSVRHGPVVAHVHGEWSHETHRRRASKWIRLRRRPPRPPAPGARREASLLTTVIVTSSLHKLGLLNLFPMHVPPVPESQADKFTKAQKSCETHTPRPYHTVTLPCMAPPDACDLTQPHGTNSLWPGGMAHASRTMFEVFNSSNWVK